MATVLGRPVPDAIAADLDAGRTTKQFFLQAPLFCCTWVTTYNRSLQVIYGSHGIAAEDKPVLYQLEPQPDGAPKGALLSGRAVDTKRLLRASVPFKLRGRMHGKLNWNAETRASHDAVYEADRAFAMACFGGLITAKKPLAFTTPNGVCLVRLAAG